MTIPEIKKNLLDSDDVVICHGANCFQTMGAGVAKAIAQKYPEAMVADMATKRGSPDKLGKFSVAKSKGKLIYNFYTQFEYGRNPAVKYADYNAIKSSLTHMIRDIQIKLDGQAYSIGLPRIGSGLAGGDWTVIKPIIDEVLADEPATIYYL